MVAGYKAVKYVLLPTYRTKVREYWRTHPQNRRADIRRMIFGVLLNFGVAWLLVDVLSHK